MNQLMTCRKAMDVTESRFEYLTCDKVWRKPIYCPGGDRHTGGVNLIQAPLRNVGTCRCDDKATTQMRRPHESYKANAQHRGGATRSSVEIWETRWSEGVASSSLTRRSTLDKGGVYG